MSGRYDKKAFDDSLPQSTVDKFKMVMNLCQNAEDNNEVIQSIEHIY